MESLVQFGSRFDIWIGVVINMDQSGHPLDEWVQSVYEELRRIAARRLNEERPGNTLQVTALVHEAYLKMRGAVKLNLPDSGDIKPEEGQPDGRERPKGTRKIQWESRSHFFASAAEAMRRILVDRARQKRSLKRGGEWDRIQIENPALLAAVDDEEFLALDLALEKLESIHPRKAQVVKLRYFAGLTIADAADALGIAPSTADADWAFAKAWLKLELDPGSS